MMITDEKEFGNGFDDSDIGRMRPGLMNMTAAKTGTKNSVNVSDGSDWNDCLTNGFDANISPEIMPSRNIRKSFLPGVAKLSASADKEFHRER